MSCTTETNGATVNFAIISDEAPPKLAEKLVIKTDHCKSDDPGEDDVFVNENETNRNESLKVENTSVDESCNSPSVITSTSNEVKSSVVTCISNPSPPDGNAGSTDAISPTTSSATTRRPSYTSKAPSALINLPKTLDEIDPNAIANAPANALQNIQTFAINGVEILAKRNVTPLSANAEFEHNEAIRNTAILQAARANYELDEYPALDTPGSSTSGNGTVAAVAANNGQITAKVKTEKLNAELYNGQTWETAASADVLTVRCRDNVGELHRVKFGSGSKGKSIKVEDRWYTPIEFETLSGRASCKDWKRSIRFHGQHLQKLIEDRYLTLHAISCTCGICRGDDTNNGPVKLFQAVKRKPSNVNSPRLKKKSFSDEYKGFFKRERLGSYTTVDGDVFSMTHDDGSMPPMTPLTPMTPITPHTPFGANCMTPLPVPPGIFRACSPPKSVTLQVPATGTQNISITNNSATITTTKTEAAAAVSSSGQYALPPPASTKIQSQADINSQQHWIQLEEMATNLVSISNKLKLMIEQVKVQSEATKDSAVTQAKIQAESEKAEAISLVRRGQLQHILQNTPITSTSEQQATPTQQYMVQVSKICQNCGREAYLECTGCYRSYYCGQFCQQKDWLSHKTKCREMVAEEIQQAQTIVVTTATTSTE